jgi:predicted transport protein
MSDIKLFRTDGNEVAELLGQSVALEKSLQTLIEKHLNVFLGIQFLATEYSTGKTHSGRIDTLGIDENGCPCIIEYKRATNENVINQGLYYLDWLLDHKGEFQLLVQKTLGQEAADSIEWSSPRLLCIAGDFTKYDSHAVQQINRNIELLRYLRFDEEFLLLELVNAVVATSSDADEPQVTDSGPAKSKGPYKTVTAQVDGADTVLRDLFEAVTATCIGFGDDVQLKTLKFYLAFKRLKNFACVEIRTSVKVVLVYVKVDPNTIELEAGFTRDVTDIGHFGTGDLEIAIRSQQDLQKALPLLQASYEGA